MALEYSLNDFPLEYQKHILREVLYKFYPFTFEDLLDFECNIDFKMLSSNQHLNWSEDILIHFKDNWDWETIKTNPIIIAYFNLASIFPEIAGLPAVKCKCELQLSACKSNKICYTEYNDELMKKDLKNPNHILYTNWINHLINDKRITSQNLGHFLLYDAVIKDGTCYKCIEKEWKAIIKKYPIEDDIDSEEVPF